ncbi:hypothetical protein A4X13_0g2539 [Tilletia indica]|uniref:Uncharacterized protein n=1 Tax=Tilletia indica TaxID=43049 RepID=A0A177TZ13_9BASI|nr:hypothetical protein A4X13_0g2539 [Tilletia indica]
MSSSSSLQSHWSANALALIHANSINNNAHASSSRRLIAANTRRASALASWPDADVRAFAAVIDDAGQFNGTCGGEPIVESVPSGACAAAFEEVTTYCCGAVGGELHGISSRNSTNGARDDDDDIDIDRNSEPLCHTTSYRTMLMCYDDLVHNSCNLSLSPSGICKSNGTSDTSTLRSASGPSSLHASPPGWAWARGSTRSGSLGKRSSDVAARSKGLSITATQCLVWTLLASSAVLSTIGVHQL